MLTELTKKMCNWPQINISVSCHGVVRFLSQNSDGTVAQLPSVHEGGVEQLQLLLKKIKLCSYCKFSLINLTLLYFEKLPNSSSM